jgi:hypothetical protein
LERPFFYTFLHCPVLKVSPRCEAKRGKSIPAAFGCDARQLKSALKYLTHVPWSADPRDGLNVEQAERAAKL